MPPPRVGTTDRVQIHSFLPSAASRSNGACPIPTTIYRTLTVGRDHWARRCRKYRICHCEACAASRGNLQGKPPARVFPLFLRFAEKNSPFPALFGTLLGYFAVCGRRPKALPLESASLWKGLSETFIRGIPYCVRAGFWALGAK